MPLYRDDRIGLKRFSALGIIQVNMGKSVKGEEMEKDNE